MKIRQLPEDERPREKLLKDGSDKLSTAEVLAILVGSGGAKRSALDIAAEILSLDRRGVVYLGECRPEEIMSVKGVGRAKACEILAAVELGKRIAACPREERRTITTSADIAAAVMEKMRYYKKEHFVCMLINAKGEIIEETCISVGDLCSSVTHPREVFVDAVRRSAGSVVFIHNHPSGADIQTTKRLMEAGMILGIPVLDHIIIGDGEYISMKAKGLI